MIFGLAGRGARALSLAPSRKTARRSGGLLLSAALTAMLTGITEPLRVHLPVRRAGAVCRALRAGGRSHYMLMHILGVGVGLTFSGRGLIDLTLFGVMQGNAKTSWLWIPVVGVIYFIVYYLVFSFMIKKFDYKTPGRGRQRNQAVHPQGCQRPQGGRGGCARRPRGFALAPDHGGSGRQG